MMQSELTGENIEIERFNLTFPLIDNSVWREVIEHARTESMNVDFQKLESLFCRKAETIRNPQSPHRKIGVCEVCVIPLEGQCGFAFHGVQ